jgi:5'-deoxynucleotidase YfbR-like HD superfamily hydrolase
VTSTETATAPPVAGLAGLLGELSDLKRVRVAGRPGSLAEQLFRRAWAALVAGAEPADVALRVTARAVAATVLAGVDGEVLEAAGLTREQADGVVARAVAARPEALDPRLRAAAPGALPGPDAPVPPFAELLCAQPRAGATAPGRPRLVLEPPESHGDHCLGVAVGAVLLAPGLGADPAACFLGALAHHLHNARLPDSGFAGEVLLGEHLEPVVRRLTDDALAELPAALRARVEGVLGLNLHLDTPEARAVVAADVLDRVLQMRHHARAAAFTLDVALDELDLVHAGPLQAYGLDVVAAAGLR